MPSATAIEDRAMWAIHSEAFAKARALGLCWQCSTELGFAATDELEGKKRAVNLHHRCALKVCSNSRRQPAPNVKSSCVSQWQL
jgi:hypothetical protein